MTTLKNIVVTILLTCGIAFGCISFIMGLQHGYDQPLDEVSDTGNITELQAITEEYFNSSSERMNRINDAAANLSFSGDIMLMFQSTYNMIKIGWNSVLIMLESALELPQFIFNIFSLLGSTLGLPSWASILIEILIIFTFIFIVIEMFFRWKLSE